jgi:uncharacterized membrane protein YdbT with pleckstrin-like domain
MGGGWALCQDTDMSSVDRYLADDEELIYVTRQHWTQLVGEYTALVIILVVAGGLLWFLPSGHTGMLERYVVIGLAVIALVWLWLVPILKWRAEVYALTTRRIHMRNGFLNKTGRSIPLVRVNDISFEASLWQRLFRCGTLKIESGSEQGLMVLKHVPDPEGFKTRIYEAMDEVEDLRGEDEAPAHHRH